MDQPPAPQPSPDRRDADRRYVMLAVRIMADFGASIAVPVVLFAALGKRLDARFGTQPWLLVIGFVLAAAVSAILIWQKAKRYGREYESIEPAPTSQPKK